MDIAIEIFEVIGSICAILTLLFFTYIWVYKLGGLVTKVDTMWDIYVKEILAEAVRENLTRRQSLYKITEKGKKILDRKVMQLISDFAKANVKLKDKSEEEILDWFIDSKEFKEIRKMMFADEVQMKNDVKAFLGLVLAYAIEKVKGREKEK